jgi:hypothetical protein
MTSFPKKSMSNFSMGKVILILIQIKKKDVISTQKIYK